MSDSKDLEQIQDSARRSLVEAPQYFFAAERKTLESRISEVTLTDEEIESAKEKQNNKTIRDAVLGIVPLGKFVKIAVDWNDGVHKEIKDAKRMAVIERYLNISDENTKSISSLSNFISDPAGNTLFNKILRILDESPPDKEQFAHLARALKTIVESDYQSLFADHRFALAQIEQLTPQALSILSDHNNWPPIQLSTMSSNSGIITSDYNDAFAIAFAGRHGISSSGIVNRMKFSIAELTTRKLMEAYLGHNEQRLCRATEGGRFLIPYLEATY